MNEHALKDRIISLLDSHKVGTLATVRNNRPNSRYMTFFNDGLMLYTPTNKETHKAEDIRENPYVHILLGYEGEGYEDPYLEIEGKVEIKDDNEMKEKVWSDRMSKWFDGPRDPEFVLLQVTPSAIRLMNDGEETPDTLEL
ncbi:MULTISPECIES: pyridoxamine 5'-phosphate oxidase family protein [Alteribacter]|uniref:General stress protein n=1 Tax=Alteribacter keqinensis TaxID=2483800 RepID=A0A3M7TVK5_9BACI|nr:MULTISPECIES: pyridoxamine 5'-phosphate oxidase family protein [Alteribacter]MBM7094502.1 pyridoxamine 5'-phosphate oxidase family protein [Alteribacter salitolerans]RNA69279.1 general stress protein [Alteribacter keqinensis]